VGKKACLVGQALEINYFRGSNYFEVCSNHINRSSFSCCIQNLLSTCSFSVGGCHICHSYWTQESECGDYPILSVKENLSELIFKLLLILFTAVHYKHNNEPRDCLQFDTYCFGLDLLS
jgi:hypothetical protein